MTSFSAQIVRLIENALARLRIPANRIDDQLAGTQVAPATHGAPGVVDLDDVLVNPVTYLAFDTTPSGVTPGEGVVYWNEDDGTLQFGLPGGNVNLQIGQEQTLRVQAAEGIANGDVVYVSGSSGVNLTVRKARADVLATAAVLGVATESISINQHGYVTTFGLVRDIDTSGYAVGAMLWLSATTAGAYTDAMPAAPNSKTIVGYVVRSHSTEGVILVNVTPPKCLQRCLGDVTETAPANGQALVYDATAGYWGPGTVGDMTNPMTAANDLIIGGTAGTPTRLAKGISGQILTVDPSTLNLVWRTPTLADIGAVGTSDSRLSDARTPTAHKTTHAAGGTDALSPSDIGAIPTSALTSNNPAALGSSAASGSSSDVARLDHVHPYPTAAQVGAAATSHTHAAVDITSGILAVARGGTGVSQQPAFFVYRASNQTGHSHNIYTKMQWTNEMVDTAGIFDLANSRTTLKTGNWLMECSVVWANAWLPAGSSFAMKLYKNGVLYLTPVGDYVDANITKYMGISNVFFVFNVTNETDYYEIYIVQTSGSTLTVLGNSTYSTRWTGVRLGA